MEPEKPDAILDLHLIVAGPPERAGAPERLGWWTSELTDDAGGALFERLLPFCRRLLFLTSERAS
jgi:hypothetical protein